ncbi:hypothetical protein WJX77_009238 [Trebouxia sp. C0004]
MSSLSLLTCLPTHRCARAVRSAAVQHSFKFARQASSCRTRTQSVAVCVRAAVIEKDEGDREGGTGVLDRPDFDQDLANLGPITESNFGATDIGGAKQLGGGDYRLLLLDDENHSEQLVVSVITTVVPSTDEQHAKNCFQTSKQLGQALVTSALKEHAEFYCEQMLRKGCKASIEPDTTTL